MTRDTPSLIDRIVADLVRRARPRSTADLAREYLGTGYLDEALAERLLGPGLGADPRLVRTPAGWEVRERSAVSYHAGSPPIGAPHLACLAPRDRPGVAFAGDPATALYSVACGGEGEVRRAEERSGRRLPRPVVDLVRCARRLRGYRGPPDPGLLAEALRAGHLEPVTDREEDPSAFAGVVLATWDRLRADLALEGIDGIDALERLLAERLEAAEFTSRGFGPADLGALPAEPGAYLFRDARGRALYVGQSGSLAARVTSYFTGPPRDEKDRVLRSEADALITRAVESGPDALLLEARWIQRYRPRLNTRIAVHGAAGEDGVLALRGGPDGRRIVLFVLRSPGLALRVATADRPRRRARAAQRAVAALFSDPAPAADRPAGGLVDTWRQAHPGELFLRPAIDGGPAQILEALLRY